MVLYLIPQLRLTYKHHRLFSDPEAPRSVTSFSTVIVWQAPSRAYGPIVGYDIMFMNGEDSIMIMKDRDELFHGVQQGNLPNGGGNVVVQVS